MELTKEERYFEKAINEGEIKCPFCGSENIAVLDVVKSSIIGVKQFVECMNCEESWKSKYSISTEQDYFVNITIKFIKVIVPIAIFGMISILVASIFAAVKKTN